ncbi:MAG: hypothetical protein KGY42_05490 [Desulfobacterales bacterium]|nr:hypothetical protein [Desulfobacterales bacterium]MBS3756595.1 hypothetical protein [Desulfobacterales bacterium]
MDEVHECPLIAALRVLIGEDPLSAPLAQVLADACARASISYDTVLAAAGPDAEELLLTAWAFKLLIPRRSAACGEWDFRLLAMRPGEIYEMPNIGRYLVKNALKTGNWEVETAVADLYRDMDEPQWRQIPELVGQLGKQAKQFTITAGGVHTACRNAGVYHRTGPLILVLKGGGILSPKLSARIAPANHHGPIYELNPSLYPDHGNPAAIT